MMIPKGLLNYTEAGSGLRVWLKSLDIKEKISKGEKEVKDWDANVSFLSYLFILF